MSNWPNYPAVYEINTTVWLNELRENTKQHVTLATVPQAELERLADFDFDALWLMGVWRRSAAAGRIAQEHAGLQAEYRRVLRDYRSEDVVGSPYAVYEYRVEPDLGGNEGLAILRQRLKDLGLRIILDFVPNHLALDHPWASDHPERFVQGDQSSLSTDLGNYFRSGTPGEEFVFAHGRASYSGAWTDTVQLDYRRRDTRQAMSDILLAIAECCDGVRCDMAMLVTQDVFLSTWRGEFDPPEAEFWPEIIRNLKTRYPDFLLLAEVYWDLEFNLQQQGFDYTYDKRLYDRLVSGDVPSVRSHLHASLEYQRRLARFTENHDEERAQDVFGFQRGKAVATIALTVPGLRLLHDGQIEGRHLRQPVQLVRRPAEPVDRDLESFYRKLLGALADTVFRRGSWRLLEPQEAWSGDIGYRCFVAYCWLLAEERRIVVINMSSRPAQCYLPLGIAPLEGSSWYLEDLLSDARYERDGDEMLNPGLYLDMPGYGYHVFQLRLRSKKVPPGFKQRCTFEEHRTGIYGITWSPDGRMLALSGEGTSIWLVNVEDCGSLRQLEGHEGVVGAVAWSPDGRMLASGSNDKTVRLWEIRGAVSKVLEGHQDNVITVAWSPDGTMLASGSTDRKTILWDVKRQQLVKEFVEQTDAVNCVAWSPDGKTLASGSGDQTIYLRDIQTRHQRILNGRDWVSSIAWSPNGRVLASGTGGGAIDLWSVETGHQIAVREGHTERVLCVAFSPDGRLLVSKSHDSSIRFWRCDSWEQIAMLEERGEYLSGVSFHPTKSILATRDDNKNVVPIWELDLETLFQTAPASRSVHYTNARVVLVGESGTGKSCLARALMGLPFEPQPSTHGISVWTLRSERIERPNGGEITREVLLWDLAGQSDYRIVQQLFLDETALAIVLFEPTHPDNPFSGVAYWEKALRRVVSDNCPRLLVAGRVDRGYPTVTAKDIQAYCEDHGFQEFIATSASTNEGVDELRAAIMRLIPWDSLAVTSSPEAWERIRTYLIDRAEGSRVLTTLSDLREEFRATYPDLAFTDSEFDSVIGHARTQGLLWRLSFGDLVLLKPESLKDYAAAVVREARKHPMGLGSVPEQSVLEGKIDFQDMTRLEDRASERSLLHAVVELFLDREIALRDIRGGGEHLVFPSKFSRKRPDFPRLPYPEVSYSFSGSVEAVYSTLVVRLFYSGAFELKQLWKDAAEFNDLVGKLCGFALENPEEGQGAISIFFEETAPMNSKVLFEKFIQRHLEKEALTGSVVRERIYRCASCREIVENKRAIQTRLEKGLAMVPCQFCGDSIVLLDSREGLLGDTKLLEQVTEQESHAKKERDKEVGILVSGIKNEIRQYDVFLSYNRSDRPPVEQIAEELKLRGLNPWLDTEIEPSVSFQKRINEIIRGVKSAAVLIGPNGLGDWQEVEMEVLYSKYVKKNLRLVPVLLPGVDKIPEDLPFLDRLQTVQFARGIDDTKALDHLEWGITGKHP